MPLWVAPSNQGLTPSVAVANAPLPLLITSPTECAPAATAAAATWVLAADDAAAAAEQAALSAWACGVCNQASGAAVVLPLAVEFPEGADNVRSLGFVTYSCVFLIKLLRCKTKRSWCFGAVASGSGLLMFMVGPLAAPNCTTLSTQAPLRADGGLGDQPDSRGLAAGRRDGAHRRRPRSGSFRKRRGAAGDVAGARRAGGRRRRGRRRVYARGERRHVCPGACLHHIMLCFCEAAAARAVQVPVHAWTGHSRFLVERMQRLLHSCHCQGNGGAASPLQHTTMGFSAASLLEL